MRCIICYAKSHLTIVSLRRLCLNAQSTDPILNYGFYLRKERLENEQKYKLQKSPPYDQRKEPLNRFPPQPITRWCYDPTTKISIGYEQLEWITKSRIEVNRFTPRVYESFKKLNGIEIKRSMERVLRECYVFDVKEYERSIKVPVDPSDRWNPLKKDQYLDYPEEQRMTKNIFTNVISTVKRELLVPQSRYVSTFIEY